MKIVVLDGYTLNPGDNPWDGVAALGDLTVHDRTPHGEIAARAAGAEILLTNKTPLSREIILALPRLKFISVLATGHNIVDTVAAREKGISVSNVPGYGTDSVAQHAIALLLELCHHAGGHDQSVRAGDWSRSPDFCYWKSPVLQLTGLTLGVIGFGRIGRRVAGIARAFGMEIVYLRKPHSKHVPTDDARGVGMEEFCRVADVITLHCALTPENNGFVNREFLARLKPTVLLINTARGALIDETDLAEALRAGVIGGAALDVLSQEPPLKDHVLLTAPHCVITPHIAWASLAARRNLMRVTENNIRAFLEGTPKNVVNGA